MIEVFEIEHGIVKPTKEILLIEPFKTIWERDNTAKKEMAMKEFGYIEFMVSYKQTNPFIGYGAQERHRNICKSVMKDLTYIPDDIVKEGLSVYKSWMEEASPTLRTYKAMVASNEKVIQWAKNVDLDLLDNKGAAVYKPNDILSVIAKGSENIKHLSTMKTTVEQEINDSIKRRNNRVINEFEKRPEDRSRR